VYAGATTAVSDISSVVLQDLNPVSIGVGDEKESSHQRSIAEELLDRVRCDIFCLHLGVSLIEVRNGYRDVPVAVAQIVRPVPIMIDCKLDFDVVFTVAQIDKTSVKPSKSNRLAMSRSSADL
jgi:hypothetical protein